MPEIEIKSSNPKKNTISRSKHLALKPIFLNKSFTKNNPVDVFSRFMMVKGFLIKNKIVLSEVFKNINFFLANNHEFIKSNYKNISWVLDDLLEKRLNSVQIFDLVLNLIKPPFVVKAIAIPKKLRKKTKQKFLMKIVYKNETKRVRSSYKQLYYYSNKFQESTFKVRLYKSFVYSFLEWKRSHLFKLKLMVFKKFFRI